jgi:two-component sensor histidine kinase
MNPEANHRPPVWQKLGFRLALAFAVSLLPLGIISGLQSRSLIEEARARSAAGLLGETLLAAGPTIRLIRSARATSQALAITMPALNSDPAQCTGAVRRLMAQSGGAFSAIAFVPVSGDVQCNTKGVPVDWSKRDRLRQMIALPEPDTVVIRNGELSGVSVLAFGYPVFDDTGQMLGFVSISVPSALLNGPKDLQSGLVDEYMRAPISLTTFDAAGLVLTSTAGLDNATVLLPRDMALADLGSNTARTFIATANDGNERIFAVFPLVDNKIFAMGSWPMQFSGGTYYLWVAPYLMPALTWLASLLVAILASEQLATRHIRDLRRSIISFAGGNHRLDDLQFGKAAVELRDVAKAYRKMTYTILRNEAELENTVHQREVLLREVHHRVKNNLQLISSIINLQMRQSHSLDARVLMKGVQDRVMSLATIHRGLYQTSGLADVRADELLTDIVRQILKMTTGPGRVFDVTTDFDDLRLTPDQAVPLSLLLTEALTNALKYAGTDTIGLPGIAILLRRVGVSEAELLVSNTMKSDVDQVPSEGATRLGTQLLVAFGQQLGARSVVTAEDGTYRLSVTFTVRSLVEGEAGIAANDAMPEDAVELA